MTQSAPDPALMEALGLPDIDADVFPSRSAGTQHALRSLNQFLRRRHLYDHVSSPTALWGLLHDGIIPANLTWERLAGGSTLATLLDRLARRRNSQRPRLMCWNLRRLVDPEPQVAKTNWLPCKLRYAREESPSYRRHTGLPTMPMYGAAYWKPPVCATPAGSQVREGDLLGGSP